MKWKEIQIHALKKDNESLSVLVQELGAKGVWTEEFGDQVILKVYISELEDYRLYLTRLNDEIDLLKLQSVTITVGEVDEASWEDEWKKYYQPSRITNQFTVKPLWTDYEESKEEKLIHLDPGMAFGTGTHPTTILAMKLLEKYAVNVESFLDVGCGSGILSIVAAKLGGKSGLATDIDPVAIAKTRENMVYNGVDHQVKVEQGDLLKGITKDFDIVIANILADVIIKMADALPRVVKSKGIFICSGIIEEKEARVNEALKGFCVVERITSGGWVALALNRC